MVRPFEVDIRNGLVSMAFGTRKAGKSLYTRAQGQRNGVGIGSPVSRGVGPAWRGPDQTCECTSGQDSPQPPSDRARCIVILTQVRRVKADGNIGHE